MNADVEKTADEQAQQPRKKHKDSFDQDSTFSYAASVDRIMCFSLNRAITSARPASPRAGSISPAERRANAFTTSAGSFFTRIPFSPFRINSGIPPVSLAITVTP